MKRTTRLAATVLMAAAISFSLIQLTTSVVKAEGCPAGYMVGCGCEFVDGVGVDGGDGHVYWTCYYICGGCNGPGEPMYIERTIQVVD